jgi:hypothetical protein
MQIRHLTACLALYRDLEILKEDTWKWWFGLLSVLQV